MSRSSRRLSLLLSLGVLVVLVALPGRTAAAPIRHAVTTAAHDDANTLTIMTNTAMFAGLTASTSSKVNTIASWYHYYHTLWQKQFPHLKIHEILVHDMSEEATKTILAVNAGNPPDIVGTDSLLGMLVARHAVMNLDAFYNRAGITPSYFLPAVAAAARVNGHWYGMPGASGPSTL